MLKRSMVKPSEPDVVKIKFVVASRAAPNVEDAGLIHKVILFGETVKSYLPTTKTVSPAWRSVFSKTAVEPLPVFEVPITYPEGELDLTTTWRRKLVLSVAVNAPRIEG